MNGPEIADAKPAPGTRAEENVLLGIVLVVVSACAYGTGAILAPPVYATGVDWLTLLTWRFVVAFLATWAWVLAAPEARAALRRLSRRRAILPVALGILYVGNTATYFAALQEVPASINALITYLYPAIVAVLATRFARRLEGRRGWTGLALATLGVALTVGAVDLSAPGAPPVAYLAIAFASPLIYAVWIVLQARYGGESSSATAGSTHAEADAAPTAALILTGTAASYVVLSAVTAHPLLPSDVPGDAWLPLLVIGLVSGALAIPTFYAGARRIGAARASLVSTVEPVYIVVMAVLFLGERLAPVQLLGGALVIGGVVLAQLERGPRGQSSSTIVPMPRESAREA